MDVPNNDMVSMGSVGIHNMMKYINSRQIFSWYDLEMDNVSSDKWQLRRRRQMSVGAEFVSLNLFKFKAWWNAII